LTGNVPWWVARKVPLPVVHAILRWRREGEVFKVLET